MIVCEKTVEVGEEIFFDYRGTELPQRKINEQNNKTNNPQISSESELNEILTTSTPITPSPFLEDSEPVHISAREYTGLLKLQLNNTVFPKIVPRMNLGSHFFLFEDFRTIIKPEKKARKPIAGTSALYHAHLELLRRRWTYLTQGSRLTSILWHAIFSMVSSEKAQEHRFLGEKKNIFFPERLMAQCSIKDRLQKLQISKKAISAKKL